MSLITLSGVRFAFPGKTVLDGVDWELNAGQKVGLIGPNGAGKTTLFRLLVGELAPDAGVIHRGRGLRIGYLQQSAVLDPERTLFDAMLDPFAGLLSIHDRLRALEARMAAGDHRLELLDEYGHLQERYEREGGYVYEAEVKATLFGLGFTADDLDLPCGALSGGQKGRAQLARLLLSKPDLLLLDEPTNHLDIAATEWLEEYLEAFPGALCVVSHDRYFLDRVVDRIAELERGRLATYVGRYSDYLPQKAQRLAQAAKAFEAQQALVARTEEFIRRNIAGQKTRQAKSRRKMLEKLERVERPVGPRRAMGLDLAASGRSGRDVLALRGVSFTFPGAPAPLLRDVTLVLERGDRAGVVGPNGAGKSTLLKLAVGELRPTGGEITIGDLTRIGYYDQELRGLDRSARVIDEAWSAAPQMELSALRDFLARFLFTGDDVFRTVGTLSGGEQSRLALAKLMLTPANCLVLDEPTNHLDIPSREVLEAALADYDGTLLVVSHDRYFLDRIVGEIYSVEGGRVRHYPGNYTEYAERRRAERAALDYPTKDLPHGPPHGATRLRGGAGQSRGASGSLEAPSGRFRGDPPLPPHAACGTGAPTGGGHLVQPASREPSSDGAAVAGGRGRGAVRGVGPAASLAAGNRHGRGSPADGQGAGAASRKAAAPSRAEQRAARARARRIAALERELAALDAEADATRAEMARPELAADWAKLGALQQRLDALQQQWAAKAEELERLEEERVVD